MLREVIVVDFLPVLVQFLEAGARDALNIEMQGASHLGVEVNVVECGAGNEDDLVAKLGLYWVAVLARWAVNLIRSPSSYTVKMVGGVVAVEAHGVESGIAWKTKYRLHGISVDV